MIFTVIWNMKEAVKYFFIGLDFWGQLFMVFVILFQGFIFYLIYKYIIRSILRKLGYAVLYRTTGSKETKSFFDKFIEKSQFKYFMDYQWSMHNLLLDNINENNRSIDNTLLDIKKNNSKSTTGIKDVLANIGNTLAAQRQQLQQLVSNISAINSEYQKLSEIVLDKNNEIRKYQEGFFRSHNKTLISKIIVNIHGIQISKLDHEAKSFFIDQNESILLSNGIERIKVEPDDIFNPEQMKVISTIETDDEKLNNTVANVTLYGYKLIQDDALVVLHPTQVTIYRFKEVKQLEDDNLEDHENSILESSKQDIDKEKDVTEISNINSNDEESIKNE